MMERALRRFILAVSVVAALGFSGCAHRTGADRPVPPAVGVAPMVGVAPAASPVEVAKAIDEATVPADQLLVVIGEGKGSSRANLYQLERGSNGWKPRAAAIAAMVGRTGFAEPDRKREGDGHTPAGLFPLEFVFGYAASVSTKMPYRQATENDIWVDDPQSPDYNSWRKKGETAATSFEEMKLPDPRYRHGVVIGYNRNPVIKGNGSAIFMHVWKAAGQSTAGCVALDEEQLVKIIGWLDPAKRPMILMGNRSDLAALPGFAELQRAGFGR